LYILCYTRARGDGESRYARAIDDTARLDVVA